MSEQYVEYTVSELGKEMAKQVLVPGTKSARGLKGQSRKQHLKDYAATHKVRLPVVVEEGAPLEDIVEEEVIEETVGEPADEIVEEVVYTKPKPPKPKKPRKILGYKMAEAPKSFPTNGKKSVAEAIFTKPLEVKEPVYSLSNPIYCADCGRKIHYDNAVAVPANGYAELVCRRCYRQSLSLRNLNDYQMFVSNNLPKYVKNRGLSPQQAMVATADLWSNPTRKEKTLARTQKAGNVLGGMGLVAFVATIGLLIWLNNRQTQVGRSS